MVNGCKNLIATMLVCVFCIGAGCTTQLAPRYDEELYLGVTATNVQVMELFATVAEGTDSSTCTARTPSYNKVIGTLDALSLQSKARPMPESEAIDKINEALSRRGIGAITGDVPPSADALQQISAQIARMKQQDCSTGLTSGVVDVFKNGVVILMDQAIFYESFLNR